MCDITSGQLILSYSRHDAAARNLLAKIREHDIEHVSYGESMTTKLEKAGLKADPELDFEFHLVYVPYGQENWKGHFLQFFYKHEVLAAFNDIVGDELALDAFSRSSHHFVAAPNHVMSLAQPPTAGGGMLSAQSFRFGPFHDQYRKLVNLPTGSGAGDCIRIAVVDSGIAPDAELRMKFPIRSQHNLVDTAIPAAAVDQHGHGTAVTLLIDDLACNVEFVVFKVAGRDGRIAEWDALAALAAKTDCHVMNLSMQFGLPHRAACTVCGRAADSPASRSAVFENLVEQVWNRRAQPVLVAAAGNSAKSELAYPSRFGHAVAIGGITSKRELATDSNYGEFDAAGVPHAHHFVAPGGEGDPDQAEAVLSGNGREWFGTSFATAFASAVIATKMSQQGLGAVKRDLLLQDLSLKADAELTNFAAAPAQFGHGIIRE